MCLTVRNGTRRRTAKNTIRVYKVLNALHGRLISVYQGTPGWAKGSMFYGPIPKIVRRYGGNSRLIFEGVHALTSLKSAMHAANGVYVGYGRAVVYAMYIPKGAKYYLGTDGDIVANKLMFPKKAKQLFARGPHERKGRVIK